MVFAEVATTVMSIAGSGMVWKGVQFYLDRFTQRAEAQEFILLGVILLVLGVILLVITERRKWRALKNDGAMLASVQ